MPRFVQANFPLPSAAARAMATHRARWAVLAVALGALAFYSFRWGAAMQPN
jgi:hypothetical protein